MQNSFIPKIMTPEQVLNSVVEGINIGNLNSLMTLYEADACFASQPGQLAKSPEGIHQSLRSFIDLKGKTRSKGKEGSSSKRSCPCNF